MRTVWLLAGLLVVGNEGADEAGLPDGSRRKGTVAVEQGRLVFKPGQGPALTAEQLDNIRLDGQPLPPLRSGVIHQVRLRPVGRIRGELVSLEIQETVLKTPWHDRLKIPGTAVFALTREPGWRTLVDEGFEDALTSWDLQGSPATTETVKTSGRRALLLKNAGQSASWALARPVTEGKVGVNVHVPEAVSGLRWDLQADFGERRLTVLLAGSGSVFSVEGAPQANSVSRWERTGGWHRVVLEFSTRSLLVTIDDRVLCSCPDQGMAGDLRRITLGCRADGAGPPRGEVAWDEFTLAVRAHEPLRLNPPSQEEELWLEGGDQLYGRLLGASRSWVNWQSSQGPRRFSWTDLIGLVPRPGPRPTGNLIGQHVQLLLRPREGPEADEMEGVLEDVGPENLRLRHASLGSLTLPRGAVAMVRPLFFGRRVEIDTTIQRGPIGRREWPVRLETVPRMAQLVYTEWPGLRTRMEVNGTPVVEVIPSAPRSELPMRRVALPIPSGRLRVGTNAIIWQSEGPGEGALGDLALEIVE